MPRLATLTAPALLLVRTQPLVLPRAPAGLLPVVQKTAARSFSYLPSLRPTIFGTSLRSNTPSSSPSQLLPTTTIDGPSVLLDLVPKSAISAHPAFAGVGTQIRCGPRPTMSNASRLIQKRRHGFLSRIRTNKGRKMLAARRAKGRRRLAHGC
ncbi:hypothetical protein B0H66DRAFT_127782 [Apodospora peruviana]|uniref:Ribosomal protein L34 n=1 Tax=Apodospora peruviana TaxID=516989 RepID=A0AAE0MC24_9PEZI|nr:hypothetical protein B0H66DRAFT_127782 [Apodospora peruviana]